MATKIQKTILACIATPATPDTNNQTDEQNTQLAELAQVNKRLKDAVNKYESAAEAIKKTHAKIIAPLEKEQKDILSKLNKSLNASNTKEVTGSGLRVYLQQPIKTTYDTDRVLSAFVHKYFHDLPNEQYIEVKKRCLRLLNFLGLKITSALYKDAVLMDKDVSSAKTEEANGDKVIKFVEL